MFDSDWLRENAGKYETHLIKTTLGIGVTGPIVNPNPRRVYLRIYTSNGSGAGSAMPSNQETESQTSGFVGLPFEVKYRDAPSLCCGGWNATGQAGLFYFSLEVIYVGP